VGVFAAYASRQGDALMDQRRFLPEPWVTNAYARRRAKRRMPAALAFQTKPQLAGAMIRELYQEGILPFKSVVAACLYGTSTDCLDAVETCPGHCQVNCEAIKDLPLYGYRGRCRGSNVPRGMIKWTRNNLSVPLNSPVLQLRPLT